MSFCGIQKLSLLDYPHKMGATLFTGGCNLVCSFCHNASLVLEENKIIPFSAIMDFLKQRQGILEAVTITGGEPLLDEYLLDKIKEIKKLGFLIKLDTNGTLPKRLINIIDSGCIDYIAMDIKNSLEKYSQTIGLENFDTKEILESIDIIKNSQLEYEFRTTIVKELHEEEDIYKIGELVKGASKFYLQNFKDSKDIIGHNLTAHSMNTLKKYQQILQNYIAVVEIRE